MAKSQAEQVGVPEDPDLKPLVPTAADPEPERPGWLPDKFKTPEAMADAYAHAERELSSTKEEVARFRDQLDQIAEQQAQWQQQQTAQPQYDPSADPIINALAAAYENGDIHQFAVLNAAITSQVAAEAAKQAVQAAQPPARDDNDRVFALLTEQQLEARYGGAWDAVKADVANYVQKNPHVIPDTRDPVVAADAFAAVTDLIMYRRAQNDQTAAAQPPAHNDVLSQLRQQKLQAQSLTGGGVRGTPAGSPRDDLLERMKTNRSYGYSGA